MHNEDDIRLRHMLEHAREAVALVHGRTRDSLNHDRMLELALTRLVEIVGEAGAKVSSSARAGFPTMPWPDIIGMRHRLIHGYDIIDRDILWDTVIDDLPPLITALEAILDPPNARGKE